MAIWPAWSTPRRKGRALLDNINQRFYFNVAPIYLAESHVKHHILSRGFLETVNGELKSAKNVEFLISI